VTRRSGPRLDSEGRVGLPGSFMWLLWPEPILLDRSEPSRLSVAVGRRLLAVHSGPDYAGTPGGVFKIR
jgi:hypothetical protein